MKLMVFIMSTFFALLGYAAEDSTVEKTVTMEKQQSHDAEIVSFFITLNNNEIASSHLATEKHIDKEVMNFAKMMIDQHTKNLQQILQLSKEENIQPTETVEVIALRDKGKQTITILTPLDKVDFEKTYMNDMVKGHHGALLEIDNVFLKQVSNPKLKQYLSDTRKAVAHHLKEAKKIQHDLDKN